MQHGAIGVFEGRPLDQRLALTLDPVQIVTVGPAAITGFGQRDLDEDARPLALVLVRPLGVQVDADDRVRPRTRSRRARASVCEGPRRSCRAALASARLARLRCSGFEQALGQEVLLRATPAITRAVDLLERASFERFEGEVEGLARRGRGVLHVQGSSPCHVDGESAPDPRSSLRPVLVGEADTDGDGRLSQMVHEAIEFLTDQAAERSISQTFDDDRHGVSAPRGWVVEQGPCRRAHPQRMVNSSSVRAHRKHSELLRVKRREPCKTRGTAAYTSSSATWNAKARHASHNATGTISSTSASMPTSSCERRVSASPMRSLAEPHNALRRARRQDAMRYGTRISADEWRSARRFELEAETLKRAAGIARVIEANEGRSLRDFTHPVRTRHRLLRAGLSPLFVAPCDRG